MNQPAIKKYGNIPHLPGSRVGPGDHHCHQGQADICTVKISDIPDPNSYVDVALASRKLGLCQEVVRRKIREGILNAIKYKNKVFIDMQSIISLNKLMTSGSICANCGKIHFRRKGLHSAKFCSSSCSYKHWFKNNTLRNRENSRRRRAIRYSIDKEYRDSGPKAKMMREWMNELKSKPCSDCGNRFPICCMDFDHRDGTKKSYNIGSMFAHHYSKALIDAELSKCDLVCSNCHRIRTRKRRTGGGKSIEWARSYLESRA